MGLIDYLLEKTLKVSPDQLYRHECAECDALVGDMLPSLPLGTPVFCHFTLNVAEHSGICIGDRIVRLGGAVRSYPPHPVFFWHVWTAETWLQTSTMRPRVETNLLPSQTLPSVRWMQSERIATTTC